MKLLYVFVSMLLLFLPFTCATTVFTNSTQSFSMNSVASMTFDNSQNILYVAGKDATSRSVLFGFYVGKYREGRAVFNSYEVENMVYYPWSNFSHISLFSNGKVYASVKGVPYIFAPFDQPTPTVPDYTFANGAGSGNVYFAEGYIHNDSTFPFVNSSDTYIFVSNEYSLFYGVSGKLPFDSKLNVSTIDSSSLGYYIKQRGQVVQSGGIPRSLHSLIITDPVTKETYGLLVGNDGKFYSSRLNRLYLTTDYLALEVADILRPIISFTVSNNVLYEYDGSAIKIYSSLNSPVPLQTIPVGKISALTVSADGRIFYFNNETKDVVVDYGVPAGCPSSTTISSFNSFALNGLDGCCGDDDWLNGDFERWN